MKPCLLFNLCCAVAWLLTGAAAANANTYVVNSTGDGDESFNRAGVCSDSPILTSGHCTLRAAIELSNSVGGANTITFNIPTTDPGYSNGVWTIRPGTALPNLTDSVSINGPGAGQLVVQPATFGYRTFNVTTTGTITLSGLTVNNSVIAGDNGGAVNNASTGTVNINNCTLSNNESYDTGGGSAGGQGGAVYNATTGTINITNSLLTGNSVFNSFSEDYGGAVFNNRGTVNISDSTLSGNYTRSTTNGSEPSKGGGAVYSYSGTLTVTNSTIANNTAPNGGGISVLATNVTITGSTFSGNFADNTDSAGGGGGAIFVHGGTTNIVNSTLSGNGALNPVGGTGGGIYAYEGTVNLTNSTVANNMVFGAQTYGGVVYNPPFGGVVNVKSTIIGSNSAQTGPDVSGAVTSAGFNLIGKKDGSTGFTAATDKKGTVASPLNPKLDPKGLRSNGGPTQTIALMTGSPAIDKGTSVGLTGTLTTDQRGSPRKVDKSVGNATGGDGTDIGAFEVQ
jgi:hypothetical protein